MARLVTSGFETQTQSTTVITHGESDNGAQSPAFQQVGTPTINTTNPRSGAACLSCAAASSYARVSGNGIYGTLDRTYYTRFALRAADATPSSNFSVFILQFNTISTVILQWTTAGALNLLDANVASIGSYTGPLADNTWYVIELETMVPTASTGTVALRVNGTQIVRSTTVDVNNDVTSPRFHLGITGATAGVSCLVDDVAVNDNQGASQNSFPDSGKIVLLKAASDNAKGTGWKQPGGDTTDIYDSVNNTPPLCDVTPAAAADVAGNALKYATNNTNVGAASHYDVNCQTYTAAGLASTDSVLVTQALVRATTDSTTGTNNFGVNQVSNPAGGSSTGLNLELSAAGAAEPTGWKTYRTVPTYGGSPTFGTAPVVRISRTETGVTRYHSTDLMGLLVEYLVVTPQDVPLGTAAALSAATVALTGPTQVPLASSPAQSDATAALSAPTQVPLGTAAAQSDATLALEPFADDYSTVVLGDGPTAYWRLGEPSGTTAVDSAAAYDGTYIATPTLAQTGAINTSSDTAVAFTAAQAEAVNIADAVGLRPDTSDFSIEFWIKRNGNPSANEFTVAKTGTGGGSEWDVAVNTSGQVRMRGAVVLTSATSIADNAWHHVVFTVDRGATSQVYIDGVQDATATAASYTLNATTRFVIGARYSAPNYELGLTGSLDEVAFYKGTILSPAQVLEHYETAMGVVAATVPLDPAAAQSAATVALKAATQVPLGTAAAQSAATIALAAATQVPLGSAPAQSAATLALKATTAIPLATAAAQSAATITLKATTAVPLATAAAQAAATLAVVSTPAIPLGTAAAQSAATIALTAQTQAVLATAAAQSAATAVFTALAQVPLGTAAAQSAASAVVVVPVELPLGTSAAQSAATAVVGYPGANVPLDTAAAQSDTGWLHLDAYDPYADATKSNAATFYWRFEEIDVARDHGFFGDTGTRTFDGTYVNSPTLGAGALARAATEKGITFVSASSQRVTATASGFGSSLDEATIEFFVKTTTSLRGVLLGAANTAGAPTSLLIRANTDAAGNALAGATRFYVSDNAAAEMRCHITTNIYDGNWHHVVGVVGASGWEVYVDGSAVTESSASGTPGTYNNFNVSLDLGALNFQGSHVQYFDGSLDEVAIYPTRFDAFGVAVHYALSLHVISPLGTSAAQSSATLALAGPAIVALGTAPAQSSASLAAKAATDVPLGAAAAQSSATLSLGVEVNAVELELAALYPDPELYPDEDLYPYIGARAQSSATLDLGVTGQLSLSTASAQSAASLAIKAPAQVVLGSAAALSSATLTVSYPLTQPLDPSAAQSAATLVLGIYVPPIDTFPDLGARDFEVTTGGVFDQTVTGGVVTGAIRSGAPVAITGGVFSEATRSGVIEITLGGYFAEGERSAAVDETVTGGYYDEGETSASEDRITGARPDEALTGADEDYWTGGEPDEDERSGDPDQVLTGGEVY